MEDYTSLSVSELKNRLRDLNLATSGNKASLIVRLSEASRDSAPVPELTRLRLQSESLKEQAVLEEEQLALLEADIVRRRRLLALKREQAELEREQTEYEREQEGTDKLLTSVASSNAFHSVFWQE